SPRRGSLPERSSYLLLAALEDERDARPRRPARSGEAPAPHAALDALGEVAEALATRDRARDGARRADRHLDVEAHAGRLPEPARLRLVAARHRGALAVHDRAHLIGAQLRVAAI